MDRWIEKWRNSFCKWNIHRILLHPKILFLNESICTFFLKQNTIFYLFIPDEKYSANLESFVSKKKIYIYIHPKGSKEIFKIFYFINTRIYRIPDLLHSKIALSLNEKYPPRWLLKRVSLGNNIFAPENIPFVATPPLPIFTIYYFFPPCSNCSNSAERRTKESRETVTYI